MRKNLLLFASAFIFYGVSALAGGYPVRAVSVICPYNPGGATDRIGRYFADALQKEIGIPFNVVNRTGGNGVTGHNALATARPDGYTLGLISMDIATLKFMGLTELTPDDFDLITQCMLSVPGFMVRKDSKYHTFQQIVDDIRSRPGQITLIGTTISGPYDLMRLAVMKKLGLKADDVKFIPTTGAAAAVVELLGGHADFAVLALGEAVPQLQSGEFRCLVHSGTERVPTFPDIPSLREQGIDVVLSASVGVGAPKGTPKEILTFLRERIDAIRASDDYGKFLSANGFNVGIYSGDDYKNSLLKVAVDCKEAMEYAGYIKK
ncbi:MAG: tripartite tricarboxylate transporter substrate binding protein [Planctomycetota bacterium]|jgi:tripartite-type tricarboxylate transporter receptor subunit TctC|nr:tripartite tricarboxylate transporter substrate binding protein [Planctomycetota bacterium]